MKNTQPTTKALTSITTQATVSCYKILLISLKIPSIFLKLLISVFQIYNYCKFNGNRTESPHGLNHHITNPQIWGFSPCGDSVLNSD